MYPFPLFAFRVTMTSVECDFDVRVTSSACAGRTFTGELVVVSLMSHQLVADLLHYHSMTPHLFPGHSLILERLLFTCPRVPVSLFFYHLSEGEIFFSEFRSVLLFLALRSFWRSEKREAQFFPPHALVSLSHFVPFCISFAAISPLIVSHAIHLILTLTRRHHKQHASRKRWGNRGKTLCLTGERRKCWFGHMRLDKIWLGGWNNAE